MIPVFQTIFHDKKAGTRGNCLSACIASIMEIDINDVPHFHDEEDYHIALVDFIWSKDWDIYSEEDPPPGYAIASGPSPRHEGVSHAVVVKDGELVHDPFPGGKGLKIVEDYYELTKE